MNQLIFASLSHTHYWYEVGMLKVPAVTLCSSSTIGKDSVHLNVFVEMAVLVDLAKVTWVRASDGNFHTTDVIRRA